MKKILFFFLPLTTLVWVVRKKKNKAAVIMVAAIEGVTLLFFFLNFLIPIFSKWVWIRIPANPKSGFIVCSNYETLEPLECSRIIKKFKERKGEFLESAVFLRSEGGLSRRNALIRIKHGKVFIRMRKRNFWYAFSY